MQVRAPFTKRKSFSKGGGSKKSYSSPTVLVDEHAETSFCETLL